MNEHGQKVVSASGPVAAAVFYLLSILLFPVSLTGYVIWIGKGILGRKPLGVSVTAQGPLTARWTEHNLGTRPDEPANRLLPGVPPLGLWLATGPTLLAHRLTGYAPKAFKYPFEGDVPPQYEASARHRPVRHPGRRLRHARLQPA